MAFASLVAAGPTHNPYGPPDPYGGYHQPQPYHQPSYGGYHQPSYHQPSYGYEHPKHNCSVEDVTEIVDICTPAFESNCEDVDITIKKIVDGEYCYTETKSVCTETIETIDNEICTYSYEPRTEDTSAKTVDVNFVKETNKQMVTVCQPGYGHGYHSYGHQYCKEVAQETAYNVPKVATIDVPVTVTYPEPVKSCTNKPIELPRISCETVTEQKCVNQPEVEDEVVYIEKCVTRLSQPDCQRVELTLPKQVCKEIVYGYAETTKKHEPAYQQPTYHEPAPQYPTKAPKPHPTYPPPANPTYAPNPHNA